MIHLLTGQEPLIDHRASAKPGSKAPAPIRPTAPLKATPSQALVISGRADPKGLEGGQLQQHQTHHRAGERGLGTQAPLSVGQEHRWWKGSLALGPRSGHSGLWASYSEARQGPRTVTFSLICGVNEGTLSPVRDTPLLSDCYLTTLYPVPRNILPTLGPWFAPQLGDKLRVLYRQASQPSRITRTRLAIQMPAPHPSLLNPSQGLSLGF